MFLEELPVPQRFRVAPAGQARRTQTFESLALAPNGRSLFTAVEGPLAPDGQTAEGENRIRVLRYEGRGKGGFRPVEEFFYLSEPGQGIVEIVALSEGELLVLERGFESGVGNTVRVYKVSLDGAEDVSDETSLAEPGLEPVEKELLVDLADCVPGGATTPGTQPNPLLDAAFLDAYFDRYEARNPERTIRVHAGDMVGASPLISSYFHDEPTVYAMNNMEFDVGTLGNHEFDEGGEEMLRLIDGGGRSDGRQFKDGPDGEPINTSDPNFPGAAFPYVAANTEYKDSGETVLPPYRVVKKDGINVGFIGVTTLETPNIVSLDAVAPSTTRTSPRRLTSTSRSSSGRRSRRSWCSPTRAARRPRLPKRSAR